tara:strand:- start:6259 stop:7407 length:1149 start_codon:yes stop_codon:yes gene_type:complete
MSTITTLGSTLIKEKQTEAMELQPIRKTVELRDIEILDNDSISYQGNVIKMTNKAFRNLLSILKVSQAFASRFEQLFNEEAKKDFLNRLKQATTVTSKSERTVTMILNPQTRSIVAFHKKNNQLISTEGFLTTVNQIIDNNNLDITNFSTDMNGGVLINTVNANSQFGISGMSDEVFTGGVTFSNNAKAGFTVAPYVNRMWCANGLSLPMAMEQYHLKELGGLHLDSFLNNINDLSKRNFNPKGFDEQVKKTMNTPASLAEMESAMHTILNSSKDVDRKYAEQWVPLQENYNAYNNKGIDTVMMQNSQKKNAHTNQSMWSIINGITHFATHDNAVTIADDTRTKLMVDAGNLFGGKRGFDLADGVINPFANSGIQQRGANLN